MKVTFWKNDAETLERISQARSTLEVNHRSFMLNRNHEHNKKGFFLRWITREDFEYFSRGCNRMHEQDLTELTSIELALYVGDVQVDIARAYSLHLIGDKNAGFYS